MTSFIYALKVLAIGILIGGGLMLFSGSSSSDARGGGGFYSKIKMLVRFIGKMVVFLALLLLPFALLKIVGLI